MESLSHNNQQILKAYAQEQWTNLSLTQQAPDDSFGHLVSSAWSAFKEKVGLPGAERVGRGLGWAMSQTHGATVSNQVISLICRNLIEPDPHARHGGGDCGTMRRGLEWIQGKAEPTFEELAKLAITPKILPLLETLGIAAGGITVPAVIALVSFVGKKILASKNGHEVLQNLPNLGSLVRYDSESNKFYDAAGNTLSDRDIKDIREVIYRYDIAARLMAADRNNIADSLKDYTTLTEDGQIAYLDGTPISACSKDQERLIKVLERLEGINPTGRHKGIRKTINLIAKHIPAPERREPVSHFLTIQDSEQAIVLRDLESGAEHRFEML
ncbi:MAG: hypothetical protein Q8K75_12790 [Chlamydiales bacterium]|nr:hypothetical protein [Chlamydiales bacterium]